MNSISDYIKTHIEAASSGAQERVLRLRERAAKHQKESARLVRVGDARQAELHASIARTHTHSALTLEQESLESAR